MAISFDLKKHDERFHPNGYDESKGSCKFRERIKDYESVDTLEGNQQDLEDAFEDLEVLERLMEKAPEEAKKRIQAKMDEIEKRIKKGGSAKGNAPAVKAVTQFGPNAVIAHDEKAFPDKNDAKWQQALANFGSRSEGWSGAGGSTGCQKIDYGGKTYYVKMAGAAANHSGRYSYDNAAVENEVAANQFQRLAGFNAPDSELYKMPKCSKDHSGGSDTYYCVTTESDISGNDVIRPQTKDEKKQLKDFYPIASLMYNADMMAHSGNAFFDKNGKLVPLDNGCAFGFSSQGERDSLRKFKFDYDGRIEADSQKNPKSGLMALAQWGAWSNAIDTGNQDKMLKHAAKYDMGELVREAKKKGIFSHLPKKCVESLEKYADSMDALSAKYKTAKPQPAVQPKEQLKSKENAEPQPKPNGAPTASPASAPSTTANPSASASPSASTSGVPMPSTQPPSTATAQAATATNNKASSAAAQRLQAMMANPNASTAQRAAYQAMLNRMNGGNSAQNTTTPSTQPATQTQPQTQTVQGSAPKQTVQPPKVQASSSNTVLNPKYKNTLFRLIALKNRAGATPSQQVAYQAMIDRLNGSAL